MDDRKKLVVAIERAKEQSEEYGLDRILVDFKAADMILELLKEQPEIVLCKDCRQAVLTTSGEVKYCKYWQGDEDGTYGGDPLYLDGDFFCAAGERRDCDD